MADSHLETQQAYAQARAYGKDLARLYAVEKERRRDLEITSQKLRAIFDTAPNGLAVIDNKLNIIEANPRFLALFEQTTDCLGQPLSLLLPVEPLLETMQTIEMDLGQSGGVEIEITKPVCRTLLVNLSSLGDNQGWVLIFHDLSERNRLEGLKNEFINIAAHELRTPLAGVMGFVSVLQEDLRESDNPVAAEITDLILQSTERLKGIIDELVDFATAQRVTEDNLHITNIDLDQLFQKSIRLLKPQIEAKGITCHFEYPDEPLIILGDQRILAETIYHLMENAVKFNKPQGKIIVRPKFIAASPASITKNNKDIVLIEIEDTGIGIPQVELDRIFDKFYQVEEHLIRAVGGLGLGLTLARRGVQQHGGELSVSSQLGQGSIFRIILPIISTTSSVSIDNRPNVAYQQMLAYAKDMAQAVVSQRKLSRKIEKFKDLAVSLTQELDCMATTEPDAEVHKNALKQSRKLAQELVDLST